MTISATRIKRASIGRFFFCAEENPPLQIFAAPIFLAQGSHLSLHEIIQSALFTDAILPAKIGVLNFQTAKERARCFGISMGQLQTGIVLVELKRVTFATIFFERNLLVKCAGRVGLMAIGAREHRS